MRRTSSRTTNTSSPGRLTDADGATMTYPRTGRRDRVELRTSRDADGTLVVSGDLDAGSADAFERVLDPILAGQAAAGDRGGASAVVIDVGGVEFMDSSGLRTLVAASLRIGRRGGRIMLRGVGPRLWRLLEITGLNDHFGIQRNDTRAATAASGMAQPSATNRSFHR